MSSKKIVFYIFNISIVILILVINNFLICYFKNLNSLFFTLLVTLSCTILYFALIKTFIDDLFKIDEKLKVKIEKTMHEINTPVATIAINTEILQTKIDDKANLERLNRINKSCDNLLKLYENMEYYIKKETDNIELVSFNLEELLLECVEKFDDLKDNIKIILDIEPTTVISDKNGFEVMVDNLISNAIKHNSLVTTIWISLQGTILSFKDDGEGISTKDIYKVFNRYFQSESSSKGFGIGLSEVKEFCDNQKIEIKINSSKKGTIFTLNLRSLVKVD